MTSILIVGTFGSDDPTRATLPFLTASGALDAGHQPQIVLVGEAAYLMKDTIAAQIQGMGIPKLTDLIQKSRDAGVPIFV
jgi:predicted peroxiredoxin